MRGHRTIILVHRLNLTLGVIAWVGIAQFIASIFWAISLFDSYSFTENFLSDLGRSYVNGADNSPAATVFNRSLLLAGGALLPFFIWMPSIFEDSPTLLRTSGVACASGFVGLGLTPYDVFFTAHHFALFACIGGLLLVSGALVIKLRLRGFAALLVAVATLVLFQAAAAYALARTFQWHIICQKLLLLAASLWLSVCVLAVSISSDRIVRSKRQMVVEQQARRYLQRLEQRGWRQ